MNQIVMLAAIEIPMFSKVLHEIQKFIRIISLTKSSIL